MNSKNMSTKDQRDSFYKNLVRYSKKYLNKKYSELDESATRIMVNNFLTEVLGYAELEEIKTEYRIRGEYADYIIQVDRKKHFVVEVKAIQLDLSDNHLRQAVSYAANEGVDWILLTNGKTFSLYKVIFSKPIESKKVFSFNLSDIKELKSSVDYLMYLTRKSVVKDELNDFWKRFRALEPAYLCKNFYSVEVVRFLKKTLKRTTNLSFSDDDILDSINIIIKAKIESDRPKTPLDVSGKKKIKVKNININESVENIEQTSA